MAAKAVARALRPGSHSFFDVNNSLGFERYWSGHVWVEKPGVVLVMRNGHNRQADRAWSDKAIADVRRADSKTPLIAPGCRTIYLARKSRC